MGQFAGLFYTGDAQALRGVYDAPYHVMGRHALCARAIASDGGAMALVVGRLRNAAALRADVRPLGEKYTASDSALLLGAYRLWGEDCAEKLEGEALLIVVDQDAERLILSTDRMGAAGSLFYGAAWRLRVIRSRFCACRAFRGASLARGSGCSSGWGRRERRG